MNRGKREASKCIMKDHKVHVCQQVATQLKNMLTSKNRAKEERPYGRVVVIV